MVKQTGLICVALLSSMLLSVKSAEAKPSSTTNSSDNSIAMHGSGRSTISGQTTPQAAPAASQQISEEKKALLRQLVEMTGSKKSYEQTQKLMVAQMQEKFNSISGQSNDLDFSKFMKELSEKFTYEKMLERIIYPAYDQYFSEEDIKGMIAFYQTPTGKKVISVTPQLSQTIFKRTLDEFMPYLTEITEKTKKPTRPRKRNR